MLRVHPYRSESLYEYADIVLPIVPFSETSGTYINCDEQWQNFKATVSPLTEARPGWKVLRVLGNFFDFPDFTYNTCAEITHEVSGAIKKMPTLVINNYEVKKLPQTTGLARISPWRFYREDNIVRRSLPLQNFCNDIQPGVYFNGLLASTLGVDVGMMVNVQQDDLMIVLPVVISEKVANDCVLIHGGTMTTSAFTNAAGIVRIEKSN